MVFSGPGETKVSEMEWIYLYLESLVYFGCKGQ